MSWDFLFSAANTLALVMWAALILLPRGEIIRALVFYAGVGLLCLTYSILLIMLITGEGSGLDFASFSSIQGIRQIFASDAGVTIGWIHYLAFDLFTGMWIARDADAKHFSRLLQAPVLLLTFLAGPLGLFIWLVIREPAARRANPRKKMKL